MSDIKDIALHINTLLKAGSFAGKPFQNGRFSGIAELVKKTDEDADNTYTMPIVMDADGEDGTEVSINDKYPFELYHRIKGQEVSDAENEDTFGDGNDKLITFTMALVVFSDRFNTQLDASEYVTALMLDIPRTLQATNITGSQWNKCEITIKEANTDKADVLAEEYGQDSFDIKQSYIALSQEYEVKLTYSKGCYTLCT